MCVEGVRPVIVAGVPLIEVVYRRGKYPSLILTRHDIVARIGSHYTTPVFGMLSAGVIRLRARKRQETFRKQHPAICWSML
jgi:hypothetical protein